MSLRVLHVLTDLDIGGAQLMASRLIEHRSPDVGVAVVTLRPDGVVAEQLARAGIRVESLGLRGPKDLMLGVRRLRTVMRSFEPDVVQTWLYHADFMGSIAARRTPIVWNLRQSAVRSTHMKGSTRSVARILAVLSRRAPTSIVCCSESARLAHVAFGYSPERMIVIENGFDTTRFRPDSKANSDVRRELGIPLDALVVGTVSRPDPEKDHATFLRSFATVRRTYPDARAVLVGVSPVDLSLSDPGMLSNGYVHLLGSRDDVERVVQTFDVFVSSSISEGFPNAIGEAMSAAIPCVVTDAGASARLVGDTGVVVPVRMPEELAHAIVDVLAMPAHDRSSLGVRARERIVANFGIADSVARYEALYREIARTSS